MLLKNLEITTRAYSKIETEETQLTINRLNKLSEIFKISTEEILGFNTSLVFNNNLKEQKGGCFTAYNNTEIEVVQKIYESQIKHLKEEIKFLRNKIDVYFK